ncbi:hypothetical protein ACFFX1_48515 [Dactylosporangium sucinum]|uniref:Uncharacterized protein n=1 Tax=Dactylosporangium sucinum TaxID=1424081 RepID=A0A917UFQ2_9ACTN|nr:hypothetical protein [Dactylosporangium sucinum]GGM89023.1 hypothetical protein GCM10007977_108810 [Dactylosporangium sucinum]
MHRIRFIARSLLPAAILAAVPVLTVGQAADAAVTTQTTRVSAGPEKLAKAPPDECFAGVGKPYPPGPPCKDGKAKVNQSYVWGLTKSGNRVWFGTGANVQCLTLGTSLAQSTPTQNDDYVCEYGSSQLSQKNGSLIAGLGDWRAPKVYLYDTSSKKLTDKTGDINKASGDDSRRLNTTIGFRAAGSNNGVVLLGGPGLLGLNLFAFDSDSGRYLGSTSLSAYGNIRRFVVADGVLYTGVGIGPSGLGGGAVLRFDGNKSNPFKYTVVANLPAQVADLTAHQGRIAVTTWPSFGGYTKLTAAGVWLSPRLSDGKPGLTKDDANAWKQVWSVYQYEPDPVVARSYGLGSIASYGGYLYWGTMHVPLDATAAMVKAYKPANDQQGALAVKNTQRTISLFRAGNTDKSSPSVELLYGASQLPKYDPKANNGAGAWALASTGYKPKYGAAGFGNPYNTYTWSMVVTKGSLYVGTMDWGYISRYSPAAALGGVRAALGTPDQKSYGADLWAFDSPQGAAKPVNTTGLGNYLSYGIRNMVADGSAIYLGMANPMNLRTNTGDNVPEGGWELLRLKTTADIQARPYHLS